MFAHPRLAALALSLLAPLAVQALNVSFTNDNYPSVLAYGQSFTLTWSGGGGSVWIGLAQGPEDDLVEATGITRKTSVQIINVISSGASSCIDATPNSPFPASYIGGNSYTWAPPSGLPAGAYVFTITEADNGFENFSPSFCVSTCYPSETSTTAPTASATFISGLPVSAKAPATSGKVVVEHPISANTPATSGTVIISKSVITNAVLPYPTTSSGGVSTVAATGTGAYYPGATGSGSTFEGSGNVLEFTGGATGVRVFGVGAMVAGALGGVMMML